MKRSQVAAAKYTCDALFCETKFGNVLKSINFDITHTKLMAMEKLDGRTHKAHLYHVAIQKDYKY